jgi:hypothetical protein
VAGEAEYPEHVKLDKVVKKSQAIGEFLDWLGTDGVSLCRWREAGPTGDEWVPAEFYPSGETIETLLARYFGIDLEVIDAEKRAMLDELRAYSAARAAGE